MKILVIGGTGTVGSQVVRELLKRNVEGKILTRSAENAKKFDFAYETANVWQPKEDKQSIAAIDVISGRIITNEAW